MPYVIHLLEALSPCPSGWLLLTALNSGEGIAPEYLPYIFDRFYRVTPSHSRNEGGIGLGLAVVKQMVEAHKGNVWVDNQPGKGSTFNIALPLLGP